MIRKEVGDQIGILIDVNNAYNLPRHCASDVSWKPWA